VGVFDYVFWEFRLGLKMQILKILSHIRLSFGSKIIESGPKMDIRAKICRIPAKSSRAYHRSSRRSVVIKYLFCHKHFFFPKMQIRQGFAQKSPKTTSARPLGYVFLGHRKFGYVFD